MFRRSIIIIECKNFESFLLDKNNNRTSWFCWWSTQRKLPDKLINSKDKER